MSIKKTILRSSIWLVLAMIAGRGAVVICGILIARFLGAETFALFAFVHLTATSVSNIAMVGLMKGLPRFIARMQMDQSVEALSRVLIAMAVVALGLSLGVFILALAPSTLIGLPEPEAKLVLLALILTIGLNNLLIGANNGLESFARITVGTMAMGGALIIGVAVAIWLDAPKLTLIAYLLATLTAATLLLPLPIRALRQRLAVQAPQFTRDDFRSVGNYIGPMFITTIMTNTGLWLAGRSLLRDESGIQAFAEYSMGFQWFALAQMASNVVGKALMPRLTRNAYTYNAEDQRTTLRVGSIFAAGGALLVFLVVLFFYPQILWLYGSEFAGAQWPLILFAGAAIIASPVALLTSAFVAHARYSPVLLSTAVWWGVVVLVAFFLGVVM